MAHPTDYASMKDISELKLSSNRMTSSYHGSHANTLVHNFLRENPNWAIDSLVKYLLSTYSDYGISREIIANQIKSYIMEK